MLDFQKPELSDRPWIQELYEASGYRGAEYSFANLYLWSSFYGEVARYGDFLCQRLHYKGIRQYLFPAGSGNFREVLDILWEDSRRDGHPFVLRSLTKDTMALLQELYPDAFVYKENRNAFDYLYEIDTLADLAGKKYQAKRNHINRFVEAHPDWYTEPVRADNLDVCRSILQKWLETHDSEGDRRAMEKAFANYDTLGFEGLILYAEPGNAAGFSMGNRISRDTFDVNFEKSFADIQGAYPLINREFARYVRRTHPEVRYLNREDDMGLENLRKAKESYHPVFLEKFTAEEKAP